MSKNKYLILYYNNLYITIITSNIFNLLTDFLILNYLNKRLL